MKSPHCWSYHFRLPHFHSPEMTLFLFFSLSVSQESKGQFGEWELSSHCSSWVGPNTTVGKRSFEIQPGVRHTSAPLPAVPFSLLLPHKIFTWNIPKTDRFFLKSPNIFVEWMWHNVFSLSIVKREFSACPSYDFTPFSFSLVPHQSVKKHSSQLLVCPVLLKVSANHLKWT